MIVGKEKPIGEILTFLKPYKKVALAACGTCVTVCLSGGEAEAEKLRNLILLKAAEEGRELEVTLCAPKRQCDREFIDEIAPLVAGADCVLSTACGAGVQLMSDVFESKAVLPALNTSFLGVSTGVGEWAERCQGCGNCALERTGGICPISRCAKSNQNGACGGSQGGKCEVDPNTPCGWQLIYDRLKLQNKLYKLTETVPPRDWRTSRDGGVRTDKRGEVILEDE
jgi:ferredoxin